MYYEIAGESNSALLSAVVSGVPAGLRISEEAIDADVARWSSRMRALSGEGQGSDCEDHVNVLSGVADGRTTGAPIVLVANNTARRPGGELQNMPLAGFPVRPGTVDLGASLKYDISDCSVLGRRFNDRLDVMRVAASGIARELLAEFGVEIISCVTRIGGISVREDPFADNAPALSPLDVEMSSVRCPSSQMTRAMEDEIARAVAQKDTLGGSFALAVYGLHAGIGTACRDKGSIQSRVAASVFSIEGVDGIEFCDASARSLLSGSGAYDKPSLNGAQGFSRASNKSKGIEGGISTGMPLVVRANVVPSPRIGRSQSSFDMGTLSSCEYRTARYCCCEVPAQAILAEGEAAFALANMYLEKFGCESMSDIHAAVSAYERRLKMSAR